MSTTKPLLRRGIAYIFAALTLAMALTAPVKAKTIMWLGNWYQQNAFRLGDVIGVDSVWVPGSAPGSNQGYYTATGGQNLYLTKASWAQAYVDTTQTHSLATNWWSVPNWLNSQYREGRFRLMMKYSYNDGPGQPPRVERPDIQEMNGQNAQNSGLIDKCMDTLNSDTLWMYLGLGQWSQAQGTPLCLDHNPYAKLVGTVHLFNPWPGRTAWVQFNGKWQTMYPEAGRPGWLIAKFYALPGATVDARMTFASGNLALDPGVQFMDLAGIANAPTKPFNFSTDPSPWEKWIAPPVDGTNNPKTLTAAPGILRTLMVRRPTWNATSLRITWKNVPGRFNLASTMYCEWYSTTFYEGLVPSAIVLNHPFEDTLLGIKGSIKSPANFQSSPTFTDWIPLSGVPAGKDTIWLNTLGLPVPTTVHPSVADAEVCREKVLAFKVYDYKLPGTYFPFSEATNGENKGMVAPTLGADGNPRWSGKSICPGNGVQAAACTDPLNAPNNWFKARPDNTTGCLKQNLTLNPATGRYEYESVGATYFPLDTLIKVVPYNEKLAGTQAHDFGFCMHAKSTFEYTPGLQFSFSGDDDVWIFIDKRLALDLGGQHGALAGDVNLDKMQLTEGKAYQFDMFMCERHTPGSNLSIKTTMNLVPSFDFRFDSTGISNGGMGIDLRYVKTQIDGSSCADDANPVLIPGPGIFLLQWPDGHLETIDPTTPQFKGVKISADLTHIDLNLDTLKTDKKLKQQGTYKVVLRFQNDPSGTNIKEIPFEILGGPVDLSADLYDRDGDGKADSLSIHSRTPVFSNGAAQWLRQAWSNSVGQRDSVLITAGLAGDSTLSVSWTQTTTPFQKRTACPATGCLEMGSVATWLPGFIDTISNPIRVLREHLAPYADSARISYSATGNSDTLRIWIGEGAMPNPAVDGLSPWVATGGPTRQKKLAIAPPSGDWSFPAGNQGRLLQLVLPAGHGIVATDSVRLADRTSDSLGNAATNSTIWVPLKVDPSASTWMLDIDGDGSPDSIAFAVRGSLQKAVSAVAHWKTSMGTDTSISFSTPAGIATGLRLPRGILPLATACVGCGIDLSIDGRVRRFPLLDSVAPVAIRASLVFGFEPGSPDTVVVQGSEAMKFASTGIYSLLGADSASAAPTGLANTNATLVPSNGELRLVVASGSIADNMLWIRLGGAVSDGGKSVGASSRWVRLSIKPSGRTYLFDSNGDGRADSLYVRLRGVLDATQAIVHWKTNSGTPDARTWNTTRSIGSFGIRPTDPANWFERGATSCTGCTVTFLGADGTPVVEWPLTDSVAPMATWANYAFGAEQDTLVVAFSETVNGLSNLAAWLEWGGASVAGTVHQIDVASNGTSAKFFLSSTDGAVDGWDSLRLAAGPNSGNVQDASGTKVGKTSPWAPIAYGIPPFQAYLSDPAGRGRGTDVRVDLARNVPKAALASVGSFRFAWTDSVGTGIDERAIPATGLAWNGISSWTGSLAIPFSLGRTGCASRCLASLVSTAGDRYREAPLQDSVPPSATWAKYRYSLPEVGFDTLLVGLSEDWNGDAPENVITPLATVGRSSRPIDVSNFVSWSLNGPTGIRIVVPAAFGSTLDNLDSARLSYLVEGSRIVDARNNRVGPNSRWVPIVFGLRPPRLQVAPYRSVLINSAKEGNGWLAPPATVPQTELLWKSGKDSGFTRIGFDGTESASGRPPLNQLDRTIGVDIRINRPLDGVLIIYDNIGTAVLSIDLSPMKALWNGGSDAERTVRVAWNGTGADHKFVASGVYLFRAVVKFEDKEGKKDFRNLVWKLGFHRDTK